MFKKFDLPDGRLQNPDYERAVISKTQGDNKYFKLFYRIRDGFAHGSFSLRLNSKNNKMIVIQDQDKDNVTARIVIGLETLISIIKIIDRKGFITATFDQTHKTDAVA